MLALIWEEPTFYLKLYWQRWKSQQNILFFFKLGWKNLIISSSWYIMLVFKLDFKNIFLMNILILVVCD